MRGFFRLDGPLYKYGNLIADILILGLLWIVFCLPIVTIGASTTAVYYVMTKRVSDKESYLLRDFWASFKSNFVTSTLANLTILAALAAVVLALRGFTVIHVSVYFFVFIETVFITIFIYPILSRFDMKYVQLFRVAFTMANRHILTSLMCVVLVVLLFIISWITAGLFLIFSPGVYFYLTSRLFMRRFKKYRPELDAEEIDEENFIYQEEKNE